MILWIGFAVCTSIIVYSGIKLAKNGDIIAEKMGLEKTLIGMMLMATVTSLPELITGISSVTYVDVPDIAVGDVLGSCVFNLLILVILDFFHRPMPLSAKAIGETSCPPGSESFCSASWRSVSFWGAALWLWAGSGCTVF